MKDFKKTIKKFIYQFLKDFWEKNDLFFYLLVILSVMAFFLGVVIYLVEDSYIWEQLVITLEDPLLVIAPLITIIVSIVTLTTYSNYTTIKKRKDYSQKLVELFPFENKTNKSGAPKNKEFDLNTLNLMRLNLESVNDIYIWCQTQAKISFIFAVVMCILGFVLLVASVVFSFISESNTTASIISAIGGTITELISLTTILVYRISLKQLSHYHQSLHEDERFLSSVNLIEKFKDEKNHDEMLKEIIRSEIHLNIIENRKRDQDKQSEKKKK
ncbi:MAG: hypothetical protein IKJ41_10870 [Clostridia bacterium]|nr:hypothetical protein [Clostridia bacterium]